MVYQCKQVANMTPIHTVHIRSQSLQKEKMRQKGLLIPATPPPHYKPSTLPPHSPPLQSPHPPPILNLLPIFDFAKGNSIIEGVRRSRPKWQNCNDFQSCSESDEINCAMQTIFVEAISPWSFTSGETRLQTRSWKSNPLPPPPPPLPLPPPPIACSVYNTHALCFGSQGSNCYAIWRRRGGFAGNFVLIFLASWKKNKHILDIL